MQSYSTVNCSSKLSSMKRQGHFRGVRPENKFCALFGTNIGYKPSPAAVPLVQPASTQAPAASARVEHSGGDPGLQDIDCLLEDLLGVGGGAGAAEQLPMMPPPQPPPRTRRPMETPQPQQQQQPQQRQQPQQQPATERERQLAAELRRTQRQLRRRQRNLGRRSSASDSGSWDEAEEAGNHQGPHLHQRSFRPEKSSQMQHRHQLYENHESYQRNNFEYQQQKQQDQSYPVLRDSKGRQNTGSYYSTADGDLEYRSVRADLADPQFVSQPPVWEKRYHTALPHRVKHQRYSERFDESLSRHRGVGGTSSQRHSRPEPQDLAESRDLLESKLQELRDQMSRAREKLQSAGRTSNSSPAAATPLIGRSARNQDRVTQQQKIATQEHLEEVKSYQEVETVSMQLIGKGIHSLESKTVVRSKPVVSDQSLTSHLTRDAERGTTSSGSSTTPTATNQRAGGQQQQPIRIDHLRQYQQQHPVNGNGGATSMLQPRPQLSSPGTVSSGQSSSLFLSPTASAASGDAAKDTMHLWYRPGISREEAITLLSQSAPGSFLVRDSNSYPGAYGLAIRIASASQQQNQQQHLQQHLQQQQQQQHQQQCVRHFLVEPAAGGVRLRGCANEPTFGSLAALVWQHSLAQMALPCRLLLPPLPRGAGAADAAAGSAGVYDQPDKIAAAAAAYASVSSTASISSSLLSGAATTFSVVYVGNVNVESLTGTEAVLRAVDALLGNGGEEQQPQQLPTAECQLRVSPGDGVTLTDQQRRLFFRRHYPLSAVLHCGLDARNRTLVSAELTSGSAQQQHHQASSSSGCRLFGLVARVGGANGGGNACTVLCERDPLQPAPVIVSLVNQLLLLGGSGSGRQ